MENARAECINAICHFPRTYRTGNRTPGYIYDRSHYADYYRDINQEDIVEVLRQHPSLLNDWLAFSDKRWTPAWAMYEISENRWSICHVRGDGSKGYEIFFRDPLTACALMVKMEMEDLRVANG
jgi:hypothetical protein